MWTILRRSLAGLILVVIVAVFLEGVNLYYGIDDAYAQWGMADRLIEFMEANDGRWPAGWEDLRSGYASRGGRVSGWSFSDFQRRVHIDFTADADQLRRLSAASENIPFDVVHARWTVGVMFDDGPNGILHRYFRHKAGLPNPPAVIENGLAVVPARN